MIRRTTRIALATVASCAATLGPAALAHADVTSDITSQPAGTLAAGAAGSAPSVSYRLFTRTLVAYSTVSAGSYR
jgi:hypothetical protein